VTAEPIRSWYPEDPPPTALQQRKHALAAQLRVLIADVLMLDSSECDEASLVQADRLLSEARQTLAGLPSVRDKDGLFGSDDDFSLFERSPFSGRCNALATPMATRFDGDRTHATATYGDAYEGPPGSVHGGHVMAAFDDLLGVAQAASGTAGFTGTLSVRMVARTPLHKQIDYEAGVESVSGRKVTVWGRSWCEGELLAEATGIFIVPREGLHAMITPE
jgi:acyl-coenzyme A thioesterase PaaI-like protein